MIRVRQIRIDVEKDSIDNLKNKIINKLKINYDELKNIEVVKKSIDARDKNNVLYIYEVNVTLKNEDKVLKKKIKDVEHIEKLKYITKNVGTQKLNYRPVIIGSGPSGLFAALILAESGFKPIIFERGEKVEDRINTVEKFWNEGILNKESNVAFGEGGAGTFSDGKLNTLVNDKESRIKKIFDTFIECGADSEIAISNKPHIGTDVLRNVIINLRNKIINLGGEIRYNSCLTDINIKDNKIESIIINNNDLIKCDVVILAIGHSAGDTIKMLYNKGFEMEPKSFAVGVRVQHKQDLINKSQYGNFSSILPPASYKLTYNTKERGIYTFCMCPGGFVVNSSIEDNHMIINGMSYNKRDSENANSAVVVSVSSKDFGDKPLDGLEFQRKLESIAFKIGNGKIPIQLYGDYKNNIVSTKFGEIKPLIKGNYCFANLNEIFPSYVNEALKDGIDNFGTKIKCFNNNDVILAGVESRTSSAIRIKRDDDYISNVLGVYPSGEGAGYSGGIITSALDGIKVAEKIIEKYSNIF